MKILDFMSLALNRPNEAYGRVEGIVDSRVEPYWVKSHSYKTSDLADVGGELKRLFNLEIEDFLAEPALEQIELRVQKGLDHLPADAPFPRVLNGDFALGRLCYALCRAFHPSSIVETGVCYGVSSAFFLQALRENNVGTLYSIDLPPLGKEADDFVGRLVPDDLHSRWELHRGTSKSLLTNMAKRIGSVDFFIHDSLHTYRNMQRELRTITPYLSPLAFVLSDDIENNPAFAEWAEQVRPSYWTALKQQNKSSLLGIAVLVKPGSHRASPRSSPAKQI